MTSHSEFIKAVSEATGWPHPDLKHRLRWLRQAGQIKGGRGGRGGAGAAQINSDAAARLLLSMAATATATLAPDAVDHAWFLEPLIWTDISRRRRGHIAKRVDRRRKAPPPTVKLSGIPSVLHPVFVPTGKTISVDVNPETGDTVSFYGRPLGDSIVELIEMARRPSTRETVETYLTYLQFDQSLAGGDIVVRDDRGKTGVIHYLAFDVGDWFHRDKHVLGGRIEIGVERKVWLPEAVFLFVADLIGLIEEPPADA